MVDSVSKRDDRGASTNDEAEAFRWLQARFPAIANHLAPFAERGRKRTDQGQFWWELQACDYYEDFIQPKIVYPDIAKSNRFCHDPGAIYLSNTAYFLPTGESFLLGVLNSKATWFSLDGISTPFGERAGEFRYRLFTQYIEQLPIPPASAAEKDPIGQLA